MPRVDFYLLDDTDERSWLKLACRLTEKAFSQSHRVCIAVDSDEEAQTLDTLLWTFRDRSFIPHAVATAATTPDEPVLITAAEAPADMSDVLINLRKEVPADFERFSRVVEPLNGEASRRQQGRARFKFYRDRGVTPESHTLAPNHDH